MRRQFGQPIGSFQIVREKLGRMATELRASRLLVYHAAWTKDRGAERITVEAAMAKSYATEAAQRIVDEAVQIVGGVGVLVGHPVERLYRSVRALRIYEGATEIQRLIIADAMLPAGIGIMTRPLDIVCVGGGPGGLYFALLMKKADPRHRIRVIERNRPEDTFGFGVVFSDATMVGIAEADADAYEDIAKQLVHWDDIDVHYRGERDPIDRPRLQRDQPSHAAAHVAGAGDHRGDRSPLRVGGHVTERHRGCRSRRRRRRCQ